MPGISTKPTQLPEELGMYVDELRRQCPSIDAVWALGRRVNDPDARDSSWELLAFGDAATLRTIRGDAALYRDDLVLMIVTDGDRFENAWGDPNARRLSDVEWRVENPQTAIYIEPIGAAKKAAAAGMRATAVRVR